MATVTALSTTRPDRPPTAKTGRGFIVKTKMGPFPKTNRSPGLHAATDAPCDCDRTGAALPPALYAL